MARTPKNQVQLIEKFCELMSNHEIIKYCEINDYGRYGNFDIHITPMKMERTTTNKLKKLVRITLEELKMNSKDSDALDLHCRKYFAPIAKREWCNYDEKTKIVGYDRLFWAFDLDFCEYDIASNSFPTIKESGGF